MNITKSRTMMSILALTFWKGVGVFLSIAIAAGIANLFGATAASDAYFFARKLVSNIAMGFERAFHLVQVPPLIARAKTGGIAALRLHLRRLSRLTFLISSLLAGLGIAFAAPIINVLAPGFDEAQVARTEPYLQVLLLTIPISAVTGLGGATLNALRLFSLPAIARLLPRLFVLVALLVGPTALGIGLLPWALLVGTVGMGAFFTYSIIRAMRTTTQFPTQAVAPDIPKYGKRRLIAMVIAQAHMIGASWIDTAVATVAGAGGVATLEFGQRLTNVAPGVAANSVISVYYTEFSRAVSDGDNDGFRAKISEGMRTAFFFAVPLATIIFVLAEPAVNVVLRHGAFTEEAALNTTRIVQLLVLLLPINALLGVTVSVIFADHRLPHILVITSSTVISVAVRILLAVTLVGTLGVVAVPVASLVSMTVLFIACFGWVWVLVGQPITLRDTISLVYVCMAGAVGYAVAWMAFGALAPLGTTRFALAAVMIVSALASGIAYLVAAGLLRLPEVSLVVGKIARKLRR